MLRRRLILASSSAYRRELLMRLMLPFEAVSPDVDERPLPGESPRALASRLSLAKAMVLSSRHPDAIVIGSDQVATDDGRRAIGKPGTRDAAVRQLREASGRELVFHSGVAVVCARTGFEGVTCIDTRVGYRRLDDATIDAYLDAEPALDCAGAARSEGLGIALLAYVRTDDPTALVGLPLIALAGLLAQAGLPVLPSERDAMASGLARASSNASTPRTGR